MTKFHNRLGFRVSIYIAIIVIPLLYVTSWQVISSESQVTSDYMIAKGKTAALAGAQAYSTILELGLQYQERRGNEAEFGLNDQERRGNEAEFGLNDLLEPTYEEIKFPFVVETKRYHTKYDRWADSSGIAALQDAIKDSSDDFVYCSGMDVGGYVPVAMRGFTAPLTGDLHEDRKHRYKVKYELPVHREAAKFLGSASPVLVQEYDRDIGGKAWDIAAPIWVRGKHFGAFRVGVRWDRIADARTASVVRIGKWFGLLLLAILTLVFATTHVAMRPLVKLTKSAYAMSLGDDLERPVSDLTKNDEGYDEIGAMSDALERLRVGVKRSIDREIAEMQRRPR